MSEERKEHWLKILGIIIATFIGAFLAFYLAVDMTLNHMFNPAHNMKRIEKLMKQEQKKTMHMEKQFGENPFEPKMAPMLVNLVKEPNEYKLIVDLKPFEGNEDNINVKLVDKIITVSGEIEKREHRKEEIMNFSQSYYLDEKLDSEKMTKEKIGNKFIITIPYED